MRERIPCVYILANGFYGTLYAGVTSNLIGRIMQHRAGTFDGYTKKHGIKRLMWYDVADTMEAAIITEKRIKKWRRDWKINLIERQNPEWNDLAVALGLDPLENSFRNSVTPAKAGVHGGMRHAARGNASYSHTELVAQPRRTAPYDDGPRPSPR